MGRSMPPYRRTSAAACDPTWFRPTRTYRRSLDAAPTAAIDALGTILPMRLVLFLVASGALSSRPLGPSRPTSTRSSSPSPRRRSRRSRTGELARRPRPAIGSFSRPSRATSKCSPTSASSTPGLGRYDDAIATYRACARHLVPERADPHEPRRWRTTRPAGAPRPLPELSLVLEANPGVYSAAAALGRLPHADGRVRQGHRACSRRLPPAHADDAAFNYVLGHGAAAEPAAPNEGAIYLDRILKQGDSAEARLLMGVALRAGARLHRRARRVRAGGRAQPATADGALALRAGAALDGRPRGRARRLHEGAGAQPQRLRVEPVPRRDPEGRAELRGGPAGTSTRR